MRSIFGKCIAIAMMAAIAIAWQSPPVQATGIEDADKYNDMTDDAADAAGDAADMAKKYAEAAKKSAEAAREAAKDARTAATAADTADDGKAADDAADDAEGAADDAEDEQETAEKAQADAESAEEDAAAPVEAAEILYRVAKAVGRSTFGLGTTVGTINVNSDQGLVDRYNELSDTAYDLDSTVLEPLVENAAGTSGGGANTDVMGKNAAGETVTVQTPLTGASTIPGLTQEVRDDAIDKFQQNLADLIKKTYLEDTTSGAEAYQKTAEDAAEDARDASAKAAANARAAKAAAVKATTAAAVATAADKVTKDKEYADAVAAAAADPSDADKAVDEVESKQAAADAAKAATDAAKAAEKYAEMPGDDDDDDMAAGDDDDDGDMMAMVTANGVGNLLKFSYWTTMGKDTLLAVTNIGTGPAAVKVQVMNGMGVPAGSVDFSLGTGDTWTAHIGASGESASTLMVGNPASGTGAQSDVTLPARYGFIEVSSMDTEYLMGVATLVNPVAGHASSYNATSLVVDDLASPDKGVAISAALAMEGDISKDMLLGRWGANAMIGGTTEIVLTFPVPMTAPTKQVAIMVTDEMGNSATAASMMLNRAVNMCMFMTDDMGDTSLSCNGGTAFAVKPNQGWFKITDPDMMGFPVIGMVSQTFDGTNGMFDQTYDIQWMEMMEAAE